MGVNIILEVNDIKDICKYLEYALSEYQKNPKNDGWDETLYNEMRIRTLQYKLKNNPKYLEHERIVKILKVNRDAGIEID